MTGATLIRAGSAVAAAAAVWSAASLPIWTLQMRAPQYPKGLSIQAYGNRITGDLRELNILNHYIGMPPIESVPAFEASAFPIAIAGLVLLCLLAPVNRWIRRAAIAAAVVMPLCMLIDLQWWLYKFGHSLNPKAPIRLKPFTPLVVGQSTMGNFESVGLPGLALVCIAAAAVLLWGGEWLARRLNPPPLTVKLPLAAGLVLVLAAGGGMSSTSATPLPLTLQQRIDAAPRGSTLVVDGGQYDGPIVIRGPLTLVGRNRPLVDGRGAGSVITIDGDEVTLRGFAVRNSGRNVTEEAAGIKASGRRHRIEENDLRDVYFGIHVSGGDGHVIARNTIAPGEKHGARPGHGVSVWNTTATRIESNRVSASRDGIYLSFTRGVVVAGNDVRHCRYGLHSMYSEDARFIGNIVSGNLLGSALMMSDRLELRGNRMSRHREGSAAYGLLLKDIGSLIAEGNTIVENRIGLYAEGVPSRPDREAILRNNVIAGNEAGFALQGSAALTLTGNRIADNLTDVRPLGRRLSSGMHWSREGVGNHWSQYRGFDRDGDGIGDVPHRVESAGEALLQRQPNIQAFLHTPAHAALEAAARLFPLLRQEPLAVDDRPLMRRPAGGAR